MTVSIALVGDEVRSYPSHRELNAVGPLLGDDVALRWVPTDGPQIHDLSGFDAVWLAPGSPYASDTNAVAAVRWARENHVPFIGVCGGLQYAVIEYFRNVLDVTGASHAEADGEDEANVVTALACSLYGEIRQVRPVAGTRFAELVGDAPFEGMHYCNYGPDRAALDRLVGAGWRIEATADDADAEVLRLDSHDFYYLTLFQPQIGALAGKPVHPLLRDFVRRARTGTRSAGNPPANRMPG